MGLMLRRMCMMGASATPTPPLIKTVTGTLLHITDALAKPAKKFTATLEPIQDLHGQDAPYPAGGGKNLIPFPYEQNSRTDGTVTFTIRDDGTIHLSGSGNSGTTYLNLFGSSTSPIPSWFEPSTQYYLTPATANGKYFCQVILYGATAQTYTGGASFTTPADFSSYTGFAIVLGVYANATNLNEDVRVMLEKGSTASAWQPYSNICPITGHTGVNVVRTGKNLFDLSKADYYNNNVIIGAHYENAQIVFDYSLVLPEGTYTATANTNMSGWYLSDSSGQIGVKYNNTTYTFTLAEKKAVSLSIYKSNTPSKSDFEDFDIQLELSSTATTYEEYKGTTIPITFPALGKNLFDQNKIAPFNSNVTITKTSDSFTVANNNSYSVGIFRDANWDIVYPVEDGQYSISIASAIATDITVYASTDGTAYSWFDNGILGGGTSATFTISGQKYIQFRGYASANGSITISKFQFEKGSTATYYEPYTTTAYGGTLTNEGGEWKLRVTDVLFEKNTSTMDNNNEDYPGWRNCGITAIIGSGYNKIFSNQPMNIGTIYGANTNGSNDLILLPKDGIAGYGKTQTEWIAIAQDVQIVIPLATPIEYTLTESQALTLLNGENNIWVDDSDDLELTYYATADS